MRKTIAASLIVLFVIGTVSHVYAAQIEPYHPNQKVYIYSKIAGTANLKDLKLKMQSFSFGYQKIKMSGSGYIKTIDNRQKGYCVPFSGMLKIYDDSMKNNFSINTHGTSCKSSSGTKQMNGYFTILDSNGAFGKMNTQEVGSLALTVANDNKVIDGTIKSNVKFG